MPIGDSTTNVGDLVEMESQGHLILKVTGEMDKVGIGDVRTHGGCGRHSRKSELSEWRLSDSSHRIIRRALKQREVCKHLRIEDH